MKEKTLVEMKNKVDALVMATSEIIGEIKNLRTLAAGTFETVKLMPGYDNAIHQIVENSKPKEENANELE